MDYSKWKAYIKIKIYQIYLLGELHYVIHFKIAHQSQIRDHGMIKRDKRIKIILIQMKYVMRYLWSILIKPRQMISKMLKLRINKNQNNPINIIVIIQNNKGIIIIKKIIQNL